MSYLTYLVYILVYQLIVLGGTGYAVFVLEHSGWWFLLAVLLASCAYKPSQWIHGNN
jgi:hypothetical protein